MNSNLQKDIIIYSSNDGKISFNVNVFNETVWLTQKQIADLFDRNQSVISRHINNIFKENELDRKSNMQKMHIANSDKPIELYNLDVIISVGYRVKSQRGVEFRRWAAQILKQYLINGYAINENRIKLIEEKIDNLGKEFKSEIQQIQKNLLEIANKPINIYNNISLANNKLEEKIIELIDHLILNGKDDKYLIEKLKEFESEIKISPKDQNTKNKIINFFEDLGNNDSDLSKKINAIDKGKKIISQLIELGIKLKNLF